MDRSLRQIRIVVGGEIVVVVGKLETVFDLLQVAASVVREPFINDVAVGLLGILKNKIARAITGLATLATVDEEVHISAIVIVDADFLEDDVGSLLRLSAGIAGAIAAWIARIVPDAILGT